MVFTLEDIEKRLFSMDEKTAQDLSCTKLALGNVTNSLKRGTQHRNNGGRRKCDGKSRFRQRSTDHANASNSKNAICYNLVIFPRSALMPSLKL